jgi:hypothetical protein
MEHEIQVVRGDRALTNGHSKVVVGVDVDRPRPEWKSTLV